MLLVSSALNVTLDDLVLFPAPMALSTFVGVIWAVGRTFILTINDQIPPTRYSRIRYFDASVCKLTLRAPRLSDLVEYKAEFIRLAMFGKCSQVLYDGKKPLHQDRILTLLCLQYKSAIRARHFQVSLISLVLCLTDSSVVKIEILRIVRRSQSKPLSCLRKTTTH